MIAMGFPKRFMLRKYVNFFESTYPGHYKIYNFSDEEYDTSKFTGEGKTNENISHISINMCLNKSPELSNL